jgi:thiamine biosynthesis lipoprotein
MCGVSQVPIPPGVAPWLGAVLGLALSGCTAAPDPSPIALWGTTMGTQYSVKVAALPSGLTAKRLQIRIDQRLESLNQQMSTYRDDSELSRFNRSRETDWFPVSGETAQVVAAAHKISQATDGLFDVTVGPLVNLWNFGPNPVPGRIPTAAEIAAARSRVDYRQLDVRLDPPALRKSRPDLYVDLSAIAKGFAVDQVAAILDEAGMASYMVEIGGEVRTRGAKGDGQPWRIGIEQPIHTARSIHRVIAPQQRALATSGDYRNFVEHEGRRYCHEIDPRTGWPIQHPLASVSVLAGSCLEADAWATALLVAGPDQALELAKRNGLDVLLIIRHGETFRDLLTPGFARHIQPTGSGSEVVAP